MPYIVTVNPNVDADKREHHALAHLRIAEETGSKRASDAATRCRDGSMYDSRRAVATLDEARMKAKDAVRSAWSDDWNAADYVPLQDIAARLPEQGGTIGPLPDGTTIRVEEVGYFDLADRADVPKVQRSTSSGDIVMRPAPGVSNEQIIAAFNEAHYGRGC